MATLTLIAPLIHAHPYSHSFSLQSSSLPLFVSTVRSHSVTPTLISSIATMICIKFLLCFRVFLVNDEMGLSWFSCFSNGFWEFLVSWDFLLCFYLSLCVCVFFCISLCILCVFISLFLGLLSSLDFGFWFLLLILILIFVFVFMLGFAFMFVNYKGKIINLKFLCLWFVCLCLCMWFWTRHDKTRLARLDEAGLGLQKNPFIKRSGFG